MIRKIIHIDMDAFFAAIEQRDNPQWQGKPLVVGSPNARGVVAAANYEARKFGIHSAMPSVTAKRKCPDLIFTRGNFDKYRYESNRIRDIFHQYTDLVEPLSIDEAFLDVTENKFNNPSATLIAKEIKQKVKTTTGLTASAGVSYCKFLAKVASDMDKPDGIFVITPEQAQDFLDALPVKKFFGVGKVTAEKMHTLGIHTGKDLRAMSQQNLIQIFGKAGAFYYNIVRGIDDRPVEPDRIRKSVGAEDTFLKDLYSRESLSGELRKIAEKVSERMLKHQALGRTITVKIKFADFEQITRSRSLINAISDENTIFTSANNMLLEALETEERPVRLLGISMSNLHALNDGEPIQLRIEFDTEIDHETDR
ncbi:DNA polymerase IV [Saccharicrinis sp. FJH54]|uniref:DNA polymerase IV n=1 Tax=Saccharicrinis sp. FJH54 TaxID=3344665 RepID=UPI0035D4C6C4